MDEFSYLQLLNDDNELLAAEDPLVGEFPSFNVNVEDFFGEFSQTASHDPSDPSDPESREAESSAPENVFSAQAVDISRFPEITSEEIEELKSASVNKNTSRSTKNWMSVFTSWCQSRHFGNVNIEQQSPDQLDNLLSKFYAEVKKKDGGDYEPESLKIMQCSIDRYLKDKNYPFSIVRSREFNNSRQILTAKAITLRQQGKGKRPNKAQPLAPEEETALWENGQLGDFNGKVLTNVNFKNLTEQLGFRGRQEHYTAYVEDLVIREQEDGTEVVEFREGPTKTRSGGLTIRRRTTPQVMHSTDGGKADPVRLFKLWLSKRPEGMKNTGPLYLSVINRPKSAEVWYSKIRMGENMIGNIMKSMASCLKTTKKLTNHSMRKTLVSKLKRAGQPRNVICEITGHARESSLDDYDEIDENQRKELSHIISGFKEAPKDKTPGKSANEVAKQHSAKEASNVQSNRTLAVERQRSPLAPVPQVQRQSQVHQVQHQTMGFNPGYQAAAAGFSGFIPPQFQYHMAASASFSAESVRNPAVNYTGCTFNYHSKYVESQSERKRRRVRIIESDDED